ncbi:AMP-binding protein [Sinosporangium siamense]|uniref:O-succinylbenzoic acid--CoA ligase n=1 Tax=Sinosporangium siamense TaxID=1367973 RepID=A0A919RPE4_9ACTN|nr:AMP-binding protein [Sinosporangium siamense]GII97423.1 O-succinylbenzoic acid--CoA ligase [Sinosporangium siamense]
MPFPLSAAVPAPLERALHAVVLPPGPALTEALTAALDGEAPAVLPLSPALPGPALREALDVLRPTHVVTEDGVRRRPGGGGVRGDVAVVIATSGTTGVPKGVELPASALLASADASLRRLGAGPGERWLCCLPPSHVSGLQVLVRAARSGTEPIVHGRFRVEEVAASGADHVSLVPTQLRRMIEAGADLSGFRTILLGGAAAPPGLLAAARERGARVVTTYGMSETSGGCVYDGLPLDGMRVAIGDGGRILLSGPTLFSGYRLAPGPTAEALTGGWFRTGDLGELAGGRLRVLGRADDLINTGGEKVVAARVAAVLAEHPSVAEVAVVGRPDPEWGERVVAVVVPRGTPPTLADLREHGRAALPSHALPRELEVTAALPLLANGKPDLAALREGRPDLPLDPRRSSETRP